MQSRRVLENIVGASLLLSASVHGLLTPDHFHEWWGYGVGFLAASLFLAGFGLLMITDAIQPPYMPGNPERARLIAYVVGIAGTLALTGLYVVTRTLGFPFGPAFGSVEAVAGPDVVAISAQALAVVGLTLLLVQTRGRVSQGALAK